MLSQAGEIMDTKQKTIELKEDGDNPQYTRRKKLSIIKRAMRDLSEQDCDTWIKEDAVVVACYEPERGLGAIDILNSLELLAKKDFLIYNPRAKAYAVCGR